MIRVVIASKIQDLCEYDKRIEKRIKSLIANLPKDPRNLQKELCEKIEGAEKWEVILLRSNGKIIYPNAKDIEIIKPVLDEIKSLEPEESLFGKLEQADVYDALRSRRPYKEEMEHGKAVEIILRGDGRTSPEDFDPRILDIFRSFSEEIKRLWEEINQIETGLMKKLKEIMEISNE